MTPSIHRNRRVLALAVGISMFAAVAGRWLWVVAQSKQVQGGDVIELRVQASQHYIWGVPTSFEQRRGGRWETLYYWRTWCGEAAGTMQPFKAGKDDVFEAIGFRGDTSFRIQIPLVPRGSYRLAKEFFQEETESSPGRVVTAEVQIEVIP